MMFTSIIILVNPLRSMKPDISNFKFHSLQFLRYLKAEFSCLC